MFSKEAIVAKLEMINSKDANLEELLGKEIIVKHDSGSWIESRVVGKDVDNSYVLLSRFTYEDGNTGELIKDHEGILVNPMIDSMKLSQVKDNYFLLSTPKGGGGYIVGNKESPELYGYFHKYFDAFGH
jgi:hypothetical protein